MPQLTHDQLMNLKIIPLDDGSVGYFFGDYKGYVHPIANGEIDPCLVRLFMSSAVLYQNTALVWKLLEHMEHSIEDAPALAELTHALNKINTLLAAAMSVSTSGMHDVATMLRKNNNANGST